MCFHTSKQPCYQKHMSIFLRRPHLHRLILLGCFATACASTPRGALRNALNANDAHGALVAYENVRAADGAENALLAEIAMTVFEKDIVNASPREKSMAFSQLQVGAAHARPLLERLSRLEDPTIRSAALALRARQGDEQAKRILRSYLDADIDSVLYYALGAADAYGDLERLITLSGHPNREVRRRAILSLANNSSVRVGDYLAELARSAEEPSIRSAALNALRSVHGTSFELIAERLSDPALPVRTSAVRAAFLLDPDRAASAILNFFSAPPDTASVEAARVVLVRQRPDNLAPELVADAQRFLRQALIAPNKSVRAQAALALRSLTDRQNYLPALTAALKAEVAAHKRHFAQSGMPGPASGQPNSMPAPSEQSADIKPGPHTSVIYAMAGALLEIGKEVDIGSERDLAFSALLDISTTTGYYGVQAAGVGLRFSRDERFFKRLIRARESKEVSERTACARALAIEAGRPDDIRVLLSDDKFAVRSAAVGAILASLREN